MARVQARRRTPRAVAARPPAPGPAADGRRRVVIEAVTPEVDSGRFPAKRTVGETVTVEADVFADGHDVVAAILRHRHSAAEAWTEVPMTALPNDRWRAEFPVTEIGRHTFTVVGWVDHFETWRRQLARRLEAGQDVKIELEAGALMVDAALSRVDGSAADAHKLASYAQALRKQRGATVAVADEALAALMSRHADRGHATTYGRELHVTVDPVKARFSSWYEVFPRSTGEPGKHGSFADLARRLPGIARMGFDVLYLPPIHPIGRTSRKGANNRPARPGEPGSPWAIGSELGGHKAVHPELGTLDDFRKLVAAAAGLGMDVALDIAFQCSPDHPYVREHPEWFKHRPDGSIQFAENPPKKYEDIFPLDYECESWRELWQELLSVFLFWVDQGVHVFRVDNPHTKPFAFWEWLIGELKAGHPEVILLSEAFTRPKVMYRLAKLGFSQSYTYFAWRNTAPELYQYFMEISRPPVRDFFRANLWPNTPDILTEYLQTGGRAAFQARLVLAATLGASYGVYGPALELYEGRPREQGSEEYLDSEKYQLRAWPSDQADNMRELMTMVNRIRRENPALQTDRGLRFHPSENDALLSYTKSSPDSGDVILTVVSVDPHHVQRGMISLPLEELGLEGDRPYQAHELLTGARYLWTGSRNFVEINPHAMPAQIFRFRHHVRSEHDFEYFL